MAFIKLVKKAVKAGAKKLTKKKKADKRKYDDLPKGVKRDIKEKKEKGGQFKAGKKVYDQPIRIRKKNKMAKSEGMLQGKRVTQEKAPTKKTKAKSIRAASDKTKKVKVPKKSDKRIEGSGSQSARPKGSIGKTRTADRPRGGTTGMKMSEARKKQMRDTANLDSEMKRLGRKYDDLPKGVKRTILMAIRSKDPAKIKKAMRGTNMTASEFAKVFNKRGKM